MGNNPTSDGNQMHGEACYLDSVMDQVSSLQTDGGVSPELPHRPASQLQPPSPKIPRRRNGLKS
ncbi:MULTISPECIES: hypothetical protein [Alicyclobacillus]|uniref:Uncharacterized protein n=1 Tax=Alicyclobacillus acidoterrestris (strain ATCC 49025 / DSM 3922 / CIP 106132 / NCIMB 13137 / GD3B) TaxID=1356854 RepID=T0DP37_ALIAG|nr:MULTISPECIES: hypothetical protein [Alicyclobacillus]EPZ53137.1 hypothetical protein N007_17990 [Alicyclobacillus acidoterrestris ATCC 49025]UNO49189.1 hypothetical protein K1I37_01070 [Alicyclobacillus acidoterrestris]